MKPREIFLSHSSRDLQFASKVVQTLRSHGLKVWFSPKHIEGGQQWHDEIGKALNRCDWFLILLSPDAVSSQWVSWELQFAVAEKRYTNKIVPLLLRDCEFKKFSWVLPSIQFIDFRGDPARGFRSLLKVWKLKYQKAAATKPK
jgi:hypothetical protein